MLACLPKSHTVLTTLQMSGKRKRQQKSTTANQTSKKAKPGMFIIHSLSNFSVDMVAAVLGNDGSIPDQPISKQVACKRCRSRKVKCEYEDNSTRCKKCIAAGLEGSCAQDMSEQPKKPTLRHRQSSQAAESLGRAQNQGAESVDSDWSQQKANCKFHYVNCVRIVVIVRCS